VTPEGRVKDKVKHILKAMGVWYFMPAANGIGTTGIPDFICCFKGRFIAIECKAGKNQPTALQQLQLKQIDDHGGLTMIINEDNILILEKVITRVFLEDSFRQ